MEVDNINIHIGKHGLKRIGGTFEPVFVDSCAVNRRMNGQFQINAILLLVYFRPVNARNKFSFATKIHKITVYSVCVNIIKYRLFLPLFSNAIYHFDYYFVIGGGGGSKGEFWSRFRENTLL